MLLRHPPTVALAAIATVVIALFLTACGGGPGDPVRGAKDSASGGFDERAAMADVRTQVGFGPRPAGSRANRRLVAWLVRDLRAAGLVDVSVQAPHRNVLATLPGTGPGYVVAGAHHDTKDIDGFLGANDGASGVAVVLELARALPNPMRGSSIQFVLFDAEEARGERPFSADGTRGSRQYVEYAAGGGGGVSLEEIRAMVLFDLVGDCDLQLPFEAGSDRDLYERFVVASTEADGSPEPFTGETAAISDDHVPFREVGIAAVDLIDFSFGADESPGPLWHTTGDTLEAVCPESLDAVGEAALRALTAIAADG